MMKKILAAVVAVALAAVLAVGFVHLRVANSKAEVVTVSTLEKIVNVSELSTYQAVYNGIAEVKNEEDEEEVDFYVSYESTVKAGIDFSEITFEINEEEKCITATLPAAKINDIEVDENSLDYIIENKKKNDADALARALEAVENDVQTESAEQGAILEMAQENAESAVKALVEPFVESLGEDYTLEVQ